MALKFLENNEYLKAKKSLLFKCRTININKEFWFKFLKKGVDFHQDTEENLLLLKDFLINYKNEFLKKFNNDFRSIIEATDSKEILELLFKTKTIDMEKIKDIAIHTEIDFYKSRNNPINQIKILLLNGANLEGENEQKETPLLYLMRKTYENDHTTIESHSREFNMIDFFLHNNAKRNRSY